MDTLDSVLRALSAHGVVRAYFKRLSPNDNTKNQIYVGGSYAALNMLPYGEVSTDSSRIGGSLGRPRFKCALSFSWLSKTGSVSPAPAAKLILYPDYPEVRLSGLLRGSQQAPNELLASRAPGRVLILGVTNLGTIIGFMVGADHGVARALASMSEDDTLLTPLPIQATAGDGRFQLLEALRNIHAKQWIDSRRLDSRGASVPCEAENCGGYTLEAELGITPNGYADPDFMGWEVKQFSSENFKKPNGVLTLMTPEPDGGYYAQHGAMAFVRKFGYPDRTGRPDRLNFGGTHYVGKRTPITGLTLQLPGYDAAGRKLVDLTGGVTLANDSGEVAASWSYAKLMEHWRRKHERAAYLASQMKEEPRRQYRYGPTAYLGTGANFETLLHGFASRAIYYDPGIKIEAASTSSPRTKKRSQFRVRFGGLKALYGAFEEESLASG